MSDLPSGASFHLFQTLMGTVPLIAITDYGGEEDRRRSGEAGFAHHLTKPLEMRELHRLLRSYPPRASR